MISEMSNLFEELFGSDDSSDGDDSTHDIVDTDESQFRLNVVRLNSVGEDDSEDSCYLEDSFHTRHLCDFSSIDVINPEEFYIKVFLESAELLWNLYTDYFHDTEIAENNSNDGQDENREFDSAGSENVNMVGDECEVTFDGHDKDENEVNENMSESTKRSREEDSIDSAGLENVNMIGDGCEVTIDGHDKEENKSNENVSKSKKRRKEEDSMETDQNSKRLLVNVCNSEHISTCDAE